jgi:hypothetical protein
MAFKQPSEVELAGVQRLKDRLAASAPPVAHNFGDTKLLRFYRGRKGVDEDAYKAVVKHVQWRIDNNVDRISQEAHKFQKEMDSGKFVVQGYDKTGRPAIFIYAAKINKYDRDLEQMRLLIIYTMEEVVKRTKPDEERMLICFDLTGFKLSCMDYDMVKLLISINEFNYPETLSVAYIINSPFIFSACWAVIRPWLDLVTAAKVTFINSDKLREYITFDPPAWVTSIQNSCAATPTEVGSTTHTEVTSSAKSPVELVADFDAQFNHQLNPDSPYSALHASSTSPSKRAKTKRRWW